MVNFKIFFFTCIFLKFFLLPPLIQYKCSSFNSMHREEARILVCNVEKIGFFFLGFCSNRDISISQSRYSTTGIPQFIVQIVNTCISSCPPSNIHLHCGWFASARMVNPRIFKRISFDDCLINGGRPLRTSQIISFTYSNSFMYPLSFKSAKFC